MANRIPHPKNVPGDFYVEDGCCTACDLPQSEAGEFFEYEITESQFYSGKKSFHCYVCKQPSTDKDLERMGNGMDIQELYCIRYKGKNKKIIAYLKNRGLGEYIDDE
ncbi:MAG: hypothetical protein IPN42_04635 [Methylococcaceae bacterium]|nr:hypothetical protein [Methylococcaceae bacterium]